MCCPGDSGLLLRSQGSHEYTLNVNKHCPNGPGEADQLLFGIKSVLSLLKIKSCPFVLWNPGQKEVCRKAGNYISLNSPLLSLASSSSTTPQDAAGYRNEYWEHLKHMK